LARARSIDRLRARNARPDLNVPVADDAAPAIASSGPTPEELTISAEDVRSVRGALAELPDTQRSLLELAYYEGLTHTEIAGRTGVPLGTVKTRIRTAMSALRGVLKP